MNEMKNEMKFELTMLMFLFNASVPVSSQSMSFGNVQGYCSDNVHITQVFVINCFTIVSFEIGKLAYLNLFHVY